MAAGGAAGEVQAALRREVGPGDQGGQITDAMGRVVDLGLRTLDLDLDDLGGGSVSASCHVAALAGPAGAWSCDTSGTFPDPLTTW